MTYRLDLAALREAAEAEVRKPVGEGNPISEWGVTKDIAFVRGAVWAAEQLPGKAELADLLEGVSDD